MWLDEDALYVMALGRLEAAQCPGCGHPRSETWEADNQQQWVAHEGICYACDAIHRRKKSLADNGGTGDLGGVAIYVTKDS